MNAIPTPGRAAYEPNVLVFLPGTQGEELKLRAGLLLMRDRAMATKPGACEESWRLLDVVEHVAGRDALRPMPLDELREIRRLAWLAVLAASGFDQLFAPKLPLEGEVERG